MAESDLGFGGLEEEDAGFESNRHWNQKKTWVDFANEEEDSILIIYSIV